MANSLGEKFNNLVDVKSLAKDAKESKGGYQEIPHGNYEVKVEKLELAESKAGNPMVKMQFKIVQGQHKNGLIFLNQAITKPFQVHKVNELLRSMVDDMEIEFLDYAQYENLLYDVHEKIDGKYEYRLEYTQGKNDYDVFEITDVFVL